MFSSAIMSANPGTIDTVAKCCGDLAVGCMDAAEHVTGVSKSLARQIEVLAELEKVTELLEADQRRAADSMDEARLLAEKAHVKLRLGTEIIRHSIAEFASLTDLRRRPGRPGGALSMAEPEHPQACQRLLVDDMCSR